MLQENPILTLSCEHIFRCRFEGKGWDKANLKSPDGDNCQGEEGNMEINPLLVLVGIFGGALLGKCFTQITLLFWEDQIFGFFDRIHEKLTGRKP